jgi:hypothetical protein
MHAPSPQDATAQLYALATDATGDIAFSGYYATSIDVGSGPLSCGAGSPVAGTVLGELGPTGSLLWARALCSPSGGASAHSLAFVGSNLYAAGDIVDGFDPACGSIAGTNIGPNSWPAGFAAEYGASGARIWSAGFGFGSATLSARPTSLVLGGSFAGSLDLGCGTLIDDVGGQPPSDIRSFLVKLNP